MPHPDAPHRAGVGTIVLLIAGFAIFVPSLAYTVFVGGIGILDWVFYPQDKGYFTAVFTALVVGVPFTLAGFAMIRHALRRRRVDKLQDAVST